MITAPKSIIIGLDGATWSILDPLMVAGVMPFTASYLQQGTRADLLSTTVPQTPSGWTTLSTGCHPGRHGIFDFVRPEPGPNGIYVKLNDARDIRRETMWSYLAARGLRVGLLNFPLTAPPLALPGYIVPGFVSSRHLRRNVHPAHLYDHVCGIPGFDPHALAWDFDVEQQAVQPLPASERDDWIAHHIVRERQWFEILRDLLVNEPCDLTAIVFDGVDKLQHLVWPALDLATYAEPRSGDEERWRVLCFDYFAQLDRFIERIVETAGPDTTVLIVSDHGFGPSHDIFHLNTWLHDEGFLQWSSDGGGNSTPGEMFAARERTQLFDWARTAAYALTPSCNGVYVTAGAPESPEYQRVCAEITEGLLALRDPDTDEPIVDAVMTREEAYPGEYADLAPDLTLRLRDHGFISVISSESPLQRRPEVRGMHRPEGVLFAAGPAIPAKNTAPACSLADIFPLVLHTLGIDPPSDLDGRLPDQLFNRPQPIRASATAGLPSLDRPLIASNGSSDITPEEEQMVFARLRSLGYLE